MPELSHQAFAKRHVIIACAPNGARRSRQDHHALPLSAEEIARASAPLPDAGVSLLHLHVRNPDGSHTLHPDAYRRAIAAVRREVGSRLVIQVTTESVGRYVPEEQMRVVRELRPEAVSLALGELCPDEAAEPAAGKFFESLGPAGTWPQYILYTAAELQRFERLRCKGFFGEDHPSCLLVLGNYLTQVDGTIDHLNALSGAVQLDDYPWWACCFGQGESRILLEVVKRGGHARIGFENNLWLESGEMASDNVDLVTRFVSALEGEKTPATADDLRSRFDLG